MNDIIEKLLKCASEKRFETIEICLKSQEDPIVIEIDDLTDFTVLKADQDILYIKLSFNHKNFSEYFEIYHKVEDIVGFAKISKIKYEKRKK